MKVALIHCPNFSFDTFSLDVARNKGYYAYPPTGLQCLKAAVETETGASAEILDLNFLMLERLQTEEKPLNRLLEDLLDEFFSDNYDVIGVSAGVIVSNVFGVKDHPFIQVLRYAKGKGVVVAGGVIATNERENLLSRGLANIVVQGEGENQLVDIIRGIEPKRGPVDFHWNLVPTYSHLPIEKYPEVGSLSPFSRMVGTRYATVQLNRGCRANCSFCGVTPFMGKGVRSYPLDSVIAEVEYLKSRGVKHLEWLDDDLLRYRGTAIELLRKLNGVTWAANNGLIASSLDEELVNVMVESGCVGFRIGVESGNEEILKKIRKPATKKSLIAASELLNEHPELFVVGCYILGHEGETYRQMKDTLDLCLRLDLSWSGFSVYQVVREGSLTEEFYQEVSNFVPPKDHVLKGDINVASLLARNEVHDRKYLDEIWFHFNLLSNYIHNKNLRPNGNPLAFVNWVKALRSSHPKNAVISLFLCLGMVLSNMDAKSQWEETTLLMDAYWMRRFRQYGLDRFLAWLPNRHEIYSTLDDLRWN